MGAPPHDIAALRSRLDSGEGPALWRSLEAVADTPAFRHFVASEFPAASRLADGPDRRSFLRLMAASFAMAGLAACGKPDDRSYEVPYVRNPDRIEPGQDLSYASSALLDGIANGILVTTRDGRPLKIEGNPDHPWSRGGTDIFAQASILDLYDPARSQAVRYLNRISTWEDFRGAMTGAFATLRENAGKGLRLLTGPVTSPTLLGQIERMRQDFPAMVWHVSAPVAREPLYQASRRAFGRRLETRWNFDKAKVVVSIGGDVLDGGPHQIAVARDWSEARRLAAARGSLLELHAASATPNLTSAKADRHVVVEPGDMLALVAALHAATEATPPGSDARARWLGRAGAALGSARGAGIVLAGVDQPLAVQEAVHRLNAALGNIGETVTFSAAVLPEAQPVEALVDAMRADQVSTLVTLDANPAYATPTALGFVEALGRVKLKVHAGWFVDETAAHADWHVPLAHPLESWGDARALDGTVSLHQPTIAPLYSGRSGIEILSLLTEAAPRDGLAVLRAQWQRSEDGATFDPAWRQAVIDGFMRDSAYPIETVQLVPETPPPAAAPPKAGGLTVLFRPDPTVRDGRSSTNGWLQELPKPLTKIVWENPIAVSPALAAREALAQGDVVTLAADGRAVRGPVWILPGQAPNAVTLFLGYGRAETDLVASVMGYDAFALLPVAADGVLDGATLTRTGQSIRFATTQDHATLEGHDFVRVQPLGAAAPLRTEGDGPSLYPPKAGQDRAWGMVIDEDACIGCNACVVACQAENNIPIVGREEVAVGRQMHWLRIDRYYSGLKGGAGLDDPDTHFQPVPCMHCEDAPCEVGCPVEATLHDHEGLNLMVYNRCIGTRACSGYCPYKVRHFNYGDYTNLRPELALQRNPEVTVRAKGVMEKCTFCVQRVAAARIVSDSTGDPIADGAVQTACQGACPTRAITFGDLADPASAVRAARQDARNYALLGELNLRPRTTYLAERGPAATGKG